MWLPGRIKTGLLPLKHPCKTGITGLMPGVTKQWKFNIYGLTREQAEYLAAAFVDIADENGLRIA